jgi:hypothetical protein
MKLLLSIALAVAVMAFRDPYYNDLEPEERIAKMRDEYDALELEIERRRRDLELRRSVSGHGPTRGLNAIRRAEQLLDEKDARHSWLHGQLYPILTIGEASGTPGYVFCRSCGAQTGEDAEFERASLCTACWTKWTPSSEQAPTDTEGTP